MKEIEDLTCDERKLYTYIVLAVYDTMRKISDDNKRRTIHIDEFWEVSKKATLKIMEELKH